MNLLPPVIHGFLAPHVMMAEPIPEWCPLYRYSWTHTPTGKTGNTRVGAPNAKVFRDLLGSWNRQQPERWLYKEL